MAIEKLIDILLFSNNCFFFLKISFWRNSASKKQKAGLDWAWQAAQLLSHCWACVLPVYWATGPFPPLLRKAHSAARPLQLHRSLLPREWRELTCKIPHRKIHTQTQRHREEIESSSSVVILDLGFVRHRETQRDTHTHTHTHLSTGGAWIFKRVDLCLSFVGVFWEWREELGRRGKEISWWKRLGPELLFWSAE
jgi:hypothetical protein